MDDSVDQRLRLAAIVLLLAAACGARDAVPGCGPAQLQEAMNAHTGSNARDCGCLLMRGDDAGATAALACAREASAARKPYRLVFGDRSAAFGVTGNAAGESWFFMLPARGDLVAFRCAQPDLTANPPVCPDHGGHR